MMTLKDFLFIASKKNPRVPVAHKQAGKESQFSTPSSFVFFIEFFSISRACASLVAVKPPAFAIWSMSLLGVSIEEKS